MKKALAEYLRPLFGLITRTDRNLPFEELFSLFRAVLTSNNKAIEIITDMGEKLGGDYLFDIVYVKRTYAELQKALTSSLITFNLLTRDRFGKLGDAYFRVDNQIRKMLQTAQNAASRSGEDVLFFEDISWDRASDAGGKVSHLAELKNVLALPVPDGFVLTVQAFDELIRHNGLEDRISALRLKVSAETSDYIELQELILGASLPPALDRSFDTAIDKMRSRCTGPCFLSVRSSAEEEDGVYSFAGQFETILNVSLIKSSLVAAYLKVLASMFSQRAQNYQKHIGISQANMRMAVGFMVMLDPASSGVMYSTRPDRDDDTVLISAAWGLGTSIVDGQVQTDIYDIGKSAPHYIKERIVGTKDSMVIRNAPEGTVKVSTPPDLRGQPSLTDAQTKELSIIALHLEKHYQMPQDIEWALDKEGKIWILQSRPLRVAEKFRLRVIDGARPGAGHRIPLQDKGIPVQRGAGGGRVYIARNSDDLEHFPKGAVLVAEYDSSDLIRVMPHAAAIITDIGSSTSHMSSVCRDLRVPAVVNTGNATSVLTHGQEVTVMVDDAGSATVFDGIMHELLETENRNSASMQDIYELRRKRYILRYIVPLNLIDPLSDDFSVEGCRTVHDILRFIHEKSLMELVEKARYGSAMLRKRAAVKLDLPVPAGIIVIDIGGGLKFSGTEKSASLEQVTSLPLRAVIRGMIYPGIWRSEAVSMTASDFLSSMIRMSDITQDTSDLVGYNVAVISKDYMNLSIKFGYHFSQIDCYCSDVPRNNHIYFRFAGGATDITKRSRRIQLLASILKEYKFKINVQGDIIIGRLSNIRKTDAEEILDQLGRLLSYTRQLDAVLHDDESVRQHSARFLAGDYTL